MAANLGPGGGPRDWDGRRALGHAGTKEASAGTNSPWRSAWEGRLLLEATERSRREWELCHRGRRAPCQERAEGVTVRRDPRGRPRSPRRNWCEAGAASRSGRAPQGGFARRGGECAGPGLCMKPLDPSEQRQLRRSPAERSRRRAAPGSASRCLRGCGLPHGRLLRLPAAVGRGPGGAVETRRRRRRRKRRRPGPGGEQHRAAAPGSPCSWPRPWWCGNG